MTTQRLAAGALTWYNITDPTIHDIAGLRRAFPAFFELHLEDALNRIERPGIVVARVLGPLLQSYFRTRNWL
jgi:hypothetical protein